MARKIIGLSRENLKILAEDGSVLLDGKILNTADFSDIVGKQLREFYPQLGDLNFRYTFPENQNPKKRIRTILLETIKIKFKREGEKRKDQLNDKEVAWLEGGHRISLKFNQAIAKKGELLLNASAQINKSSPYRRAELFLALPLKSFEGNEVVYLVLSDAG